MSIQRWILLILMAMREQKVDVCPQTTRPIPEEEGDDEWLYVKREAWE